MYFLLQCYESHIYALESCYLRDSQKNPTLLAFLIIWNDTPVNIFSPVSYSSSFFTLCACFWWDFDFKQKVEGVYHSCSQPTLGERKLPTLLSFISLLHQGLPQGCCSVNTYYKEVTIILFYFKPFIFRSNKNILISFQCFTHLICD